MSDESSILRTIEAATGTEPREFFAMDQVGTASVDGLAGDDRVCGLAAGRVDAPRRGLQPDSRRVGVGDNLPPASLDSLTRLRNWWYEFRRRAYAEVCDNGRRYRIYADRHGRIHFKTPLLLTPDNGRTVTFSPGRGKITIFTPLP